MGRGRSVRRDGEHHDRLCARGREALGRRAHDRGGEEVPGRGIAAGGGGDASRHQPRRAEDERGGVRARPADLLRALRRLPRRAAQGCDRQAVDARHHHRARHRVPQGVHQLRLAGRHAELGDLRGADRQRSRHHGAVRPADPAHAAGIRHEGDEGELEGNRAPGPASDQEDEQLQHQQHLLHHTARFGRSGADRRRHQEDHQHRQDRLRRAHLAAVGVGALSVRHRARREGQPHRPVDGEARQRRRDQGRPGGALGGHLQVQGLRGQARDRRLLLAAAVRDHEQATPWSPSRSCRPAA